MQPLTRARVRQQWWRVEKSSRRMLLRAYLKEVCLGSNTSACRACVCGCALVQHPCKLPSSMHINAVQWQIQFKPEELWIPTHKQKHESKHFLVFSWLTGEMGSTTPANDACKPAFQIQCCMHSLQTLHHVLTCSCS